MKLFLQSQGLDVWMAIENGYNVPDTTPVGGTTERRLLGPYSTHTTPILLLCSP